MSTLQQLRFANKWLEMAISKNKLGEFIIGLPPYAKMKTNDAGVSEAVLEPNLKSLYYYYEKHKEIKFDKDVENALFQIIETKGDKDFIIYETLVFINMQLEHEKRGDAKFSLDCSRLLSSIRKKIEENKDKFKEKSTNFENSVWSAIEFYDNHMSENYNQHVL